MHRKKKSFKSKGSSKGRTGTKKVQKDEGVSRLWVAVSLASISLVFAVCAFGIYNALKYEAQKAFDRGAEYLAKGHWEDALEMHTKALQIGFGLPESKYAILNSMGIALAKLERNEEAIKSFNTAMTHSEINYLSKINLGKSLKRVGKHSLALKAFEDVVGLRALCEPHRQVGKQSNEETRPPFCQELAKRKLDFQDSLQTAYFQAALIHKKQRAMLQAEHYLKQTLKIRETGTTGENIAEVLWQLGDLSEEQGMNNIARSYYKRCSQVSEETFMQGSCLAKVGVLLEEVEKTKEAEHFYAEAIKVVPDHGFANSRLEVLMHKHEIQKNASKANSQQKEESMAASKPHVDVLSPGEEITPP